MRAAAFYDERVAGAETTAGAIDARAGLNPQEPDSYYYMLGYNAEKALP